jgi:sec-independent protein translocase protein TatC
MKEKSENEDEDEEDYGLEGDLYGTDTDSEEGAGDGMGFLEHLEEFRWTVGRSLLAFIVGVVLATFFIRDIATFLEMPLLTAYGSVELVQENLKTYRPMGVISVFIQVALLSGLIMSMPFVLYFIASFIAPGLTEKERRVLRPACFSAFILFLLGVSFAFFFILPVTLAFSVRLNLFFGFDLLWAASEYYNMIVWFSLTTGAFFQFPLIIVILVYLGVLSVEKLKSVRRAVCVGLMVFSAFMTPGGDFITLPVITAIMYSLYELAIWVGSRVEKKKREAELAAWDED